MKCLKCIVEDDLALAPDEYEMRTDQVAHDAVTVVDGKAVCARHLGDVFGINVRRQA